MSAAGRRPRSVPVTLWLLAAIFLVGTPATPQIDPGGDGDSSPRVRRLAGVAAEAAALVFSGRDGGEIPTFAWAAPLVPASGLTPVPFVLEIEGARLLGPQVPGTQVPGAQVPGAQVPGAGPGNSLTVEVHAYALDEAGRTRGHPGWSFTLDVDAVGESLFAAGIRFHGSLELPPAGYQLRFLVREPESGRYGLRSLEVRVPAVAVAEPLVLPPVVRGARSGWIEVRSAAVVPDGPIAAAAEPPQALPMLPIAGTAAAELWVYRLPAAEPTLEARLLSLETGAESAIEATICSRGPTGLPGLERLDLALALPELAVGNYRLTLTVVGEAGLRLAAPPLPVYLLTSDLLAAVPAWVSLGRLTEQATTAAPGRPTGRVAGQPVRSAPAEAPAGSKKGAIERRYRWALADLVAGELDAAIAALAELEEATLAVPTASKEPPLARAELAVARSLGKREPESLLALADLHLELDARYGEKGSLAAARHSRWMAENLAVEYATRVDTPAARRSAAEILALLGLEAQEAQLSAASRRYLEGALELDPESPTALLGMAGLYERRGAYREAIPYLRRLVIANAKSAEARLRLALCLAREGNGTQADEILRRLVAEDNPDWILVLAYQELAGSALEAGEVDRALRLIDDAVTRLPDYFRLHLQRAYLLDRAGQAREARQVIEGLVDLPSKEGDSPRHNYHRPPGSADRERMKAALRRAAVLRLAALGRALEATG